MDYTTRTWQHDSIAVTSYGPGMWPRQAVRMLLGHLPRGETRTITHVTVPGRPEYRVTLTWPTYGSDLGDWPQMYTQPMYYPGENGGPRSTGTTVWLDAATSLPLRVSVTGTGGRVLAAETLSWLPPDRASRAKLRSAPVPAGFTLGP